MKKEKLNLSHFEIIRTPIITEKSSIAAEQAKYTFNVEKQSTKETVAKAVETIFNVKVKKVNIVNQAGKVKRFRGKLGKRSDYKKAIVTLEKDEILDFTGGIK